MSKTFVCGLCKRTRTTSQRTAGQATCRDKKSCREAQVKWIASWPEPLRGTAGYDPL